MRNHTAEALDQDLTGCLDETELATFQTRQVLGLYKLELERQTGVTLRMPSWVHSY